MMSLQTLNEEYGTTIIVIEHHTEFIANYCKQVVLMDQGRIVWKKEVREALCSVDDLVQRQIYPPQVTLAAHGISEDGNYPITLDEAVKYFGVKFNDSFCYTSIYETYKTACFTVEKYNSPISYPSKTKKNGVKLDFYDFLSKEIKSLSLEIMEQENPLY